MDLINFKMIVACVHNDNDMYGIIGKDNNIPWYLSEDLRMFRKMTLNNVVIMGRKTFESLPNGPLPRRYNIVITNSVNNIVNNYNNLVFSNVINLPDILANIGNKEIFVIGGAEIYNLFYDRCHIIYMTKIYNNNISGNKYFPISFNKLE